MRTHGERELTTGLLSKDASFRLIVSGKVGEKEIERLIRKLEFDKEILADIGNEDESTQTTFSDGTLTQEQRDWFKTRDGG